MAFSSPYDASYRLPLSYKWMMASALGIVVLLVLIVLACSYWFSHGKIPSRGGLYFFKRVTLPVPIFAQGDPRWKNDLLGPTEATLHAEGCAVASAAMVLAFYGVDTDPGRLNAFLKETEGGYTPQGWIYWEKAAEIEPGGTIEKAYEDDPSYARIDWNLLQGNPVIVRVKLPRNNHFVVIAGKNGFEYLVADPGAAGQGGLRPLSEVAPEIHALRYYRRLP